MGPTQRPQSPTERGPPIRGQLEKIFKDFFISLRIYPAPPPGGSIKMFFITFISLAPQPRLTKNFVKILIQGGVHIKLGSGPSTSLIQP